MKMKMIMAGLILSGTLLPAVADARGFSSGSRSSSFSRPSTPVRSTPAPAPKTSSTPKSSTPKSSTPKSSTSKNTTSKSGTKTYRNNSTKKSTASKLSKKTISKGLKKTRMKQQSKQLKSFSTLPKSSYMSKPYGYQNSMMFSNNWLMYFLIFNALTPNEQQRAIAANVDEDVYTVTVEHDGKDRVYVVTEDVYNKVNEGTPVHIEDGQVTIK